MTDIDKIQGNAYQVRWRYADGWIGKSTKVDTNLLYFVSCLDRMFFMHDYFVELHKLH